MKSFEERCAEMDAEFEVACAEMKKNHEESTATMLAEHRASMKNQPVSEEMASFNARFERVKAEIAESEGTAVDGNPFHHAHVHLEQNHNQAHQQHVQQHQQFVNDTMMQTHLQIHHSF